MNPENSEMSDMPERDVEKRYLTTSQAAKVLSVSPDTVLKWVRAGKIKSYRTLGGHFRIPKDALLLFTPDSSDKSESPALSGITPGHQYCWEYLAVDGKIKAECMDCITYRSRARRCYELKELPEGLGCLRLYCEADCVDCEYYTLVHSQELNIIILSQNKLILTDYKRKDEITDLHIQFVDDEYEVSYLVQNFRPDYIVVDCALGRKRTGLICLNFFNDPRIPVTRIILASKSKDIHDYCDREIFGWIRKPFTIQRLKDCIYGVPEIEE